MYIQISKVGLIL